MLMNLNDIKLSLKTNKGNTIAHNQLEDDGNLQLTFYMCKFRRFKNQSLIKRLNYYFLLEFICAQCQEEEVIDWGKCGNYCPMNYILRKMNIWKTK